MTKRNRPRKSKPWKILLEAFDNDTDQLYDYISSMQKGEGVGIIKEKLCKCTFWPKHIAPWIGRELNWTPIANE